MTKCNRQCGYNPDARCNLQKGHAGPHSNAGRQYKIGERLCPYCGTTVVDATAKRFCNGIRPAAKDATGCEFCNPAAVTQVFSVDKVSEGGIGQRDAIRLLREAGIEAKRAYSPYVGQTGVEVTGTAAQIEQTEEILY